MSALLMPDPVPPPVAGVDLRLCDVATMCADTTIRADFVHADPPWLYRSGGVFRGLQGGNAGTCEDHYATITMPEIVAHVDAAYDAAADDCYLALWSTWPTLFEWFAASRPMRWTYKTGGCWHKIGRMGIGFHVRGDTEPVLIYTKGKPKPLCAISNGHASKRSAHSEKPVPFLRSMLRAWSPDGGTVMDLYAGLAPLARACVDEGRQYVGAEIDPKRRADALALLARHAPQRAARHESGPLWGSHE